MSAAKVERGITMPDCQPAEISFMILIGSMTMIFLVLALREDFLRWKGR